MPTSHLVKTLESSFVDAVTSGELERAEHLATAMVRMRRERIESLLLRGHVLLRSNHYNIRDGRYRQRDYLATAIVSTYRAERFIKGRLEDLLNQTLGDRLEILVLDSASPEGEGEIVAEFQRHVDTIRYLRTDRRESIYQSWNRGISLANGLYITNANTDDRLKINALEHLVTALAQNPSTGIAYANFLLTTRENETFDANHAVEATHRPPYSLNALLENCITGSQPIWRKSLHESVGKFDIGYASAADYDFFVRAASQTGCTFILEPLGLVLVSPETFSGKGRLPTLEAYKIRECYRHLLSPTGRDNQLSAEESRLLAELANHGLMGANDQIELHADQSPAFSYEIGLLHELRGDLGMAWRYLQRAHYLAPERNEYRSALERCLAANLRSAAMETAVAIREQATHDGLLSIGLIAGMLGCPATAAWFYYQAIETRPDDAVAVTNLKRNLKVLPKGS